MCVCFHVCVFRCVCVYKRMCKRCYFCLWRVYNIGRERNQSFNIGQMCWILKEKLKMSHVVARNDVLLWFRETGGKLQRKRWHLLKRWGLCCFFQGAFSKSSVTWLPLNSASTTALLTWPPTSLWSDGVGPSQSLPERLHSTDHSSAALLSLRVICLQLWLILVGWDVSHLLSREGAQVITKHSHSWDHHAKMHLLKLAPGKHGHSREETRLSGRGHGGRPQRGPRWTYSQWKVITCPLGRKQTSVSLSISISFDSVLPAGCALRSWLLLAGSFFHFTKQEQSEVLILANLFIQVP